MCKTLTSEAKRKESYKIRTHGSGSLTYPSRLLKTKGLFLICEDPNNSSDNVLIRLRPGFRR